MTPKSPNTSSSLLANIPIWNPIAYDSNIVHSLKFIVNCSFSSFLAEDAMLIKARTGTHIKIIYNLLSCKGATDSYKSTTLLWSIVFSLLYTILAQDFPSGPLSSTISTSINSYALCSWVQCLSFYLSLSHCFQLLGQHLIESKSTNTHSMGDGGNWLCEECPAKALSA